MPNFDGENSVGASIEDTKTMKTIADFPAIVIDGLKSDRCLGEYLAHIYPFPVPFDFTVVANVPNFNIALIFHRQWPQR